MIISRKRFQEEIYNRLDAERREIYQRNALEEMRMAHEREVARMELRLARLEEEIWGKKRHENSNNLQGL